MVMAVTAQDASITTSDGEISDVTFSPDMTVSWSGLDEDATQYRTEIYLSADGSNWDYYTGSNPSVSSGDARSGSATLSYSDMSVLSSGAFAASDFAASDGTTKDTTVYVRIVVRMQDGSGTDIASTTETTSFVVSVTNSAASVTVDSTIATSVTG